MERSIQENILENFRFTKFLRSFFQKMKKFDGKNDIMRTLKELNRRKAMTMGRQ